MKNIKDKKIIALFLILLVFTICYFVIANKISYAFENNYDITSAYESKVKTIEKCAEAYGHSHSDEFNEEGVIYLTVQNLIDKGYLVPDENGKIQNVLNENESLNNKKIRIKKDDEKLIAEIYS